MNIRTLYLVPHSHTDIGYSHDPLATVELHDRFLDRALGLCEQTRDAPEGARFRWTVECFFSALHWWEHRGAADHARLRDCLARGEIDIGARYLNGTELYAPEDVAWEAVQSERLVALTGYRPVTAIQNDVNGFPLAFARSLAGAGVSTLVMGLNTTMGHSPFPRCSAFRWNLGGGREWLVWNGWIYNRIKGYCHLDELGDRFHGQVAAFLASLPRDYPYDFAMTSALIGDNTGPFVNLPEQVRRFNQSSATLQLRLATFAEFAAALRGQAGELPTYAGQWPDFWTFGAGSMPQWVGMVRRAQRRLRLVERFRALGWASETGGSLTLDCARRAIAGFCEHTYDSHTSAGEHCGSPDALRQKAQIQVAAATAETAAMVLLRDHLSAMAAGRSKEPVSVLVANPHSHGLALDYLTDRKGMLAFATSRQPEHLFQFDREPTYEALAQSGNFGARGVLAPPTRVSCTPLADLAPATDEELAADTGATVLRAGDAELRFAAAERPNQATGVPRLRLVSWQPAPGVEVLDAGAEWPPFALVEERPLTPFQTGGMKDMDPADAAWNPDLRLARRELPHPGRYRRQSGEAGQSLAFEGDNGLLRRLEFTLDPRQPGVLNVTAALHYDADPAVRSYYLALPLILPGAGDCDYWVDNCGVWFRAETEQLPGTCNSFYQAYCGVAVSRGGRTLYIASPDTTLVQFGGLTFGQLPTTPLERRRPFVALWLYNNYWGTNFPGYSPGEARARYRLLLAAGGFDPVHMQRLDAGFDTEFLTHPVA